MSKKTPGVRRRSPRVEKKWEQARREILEIARNILREGGIEAVTLASVAARLGMTKQALYHYFPSKEALVRSLVTNLLDHEIEMLVASIRESGSVEDTLGTLIRAFYDHYITRLNAFRAIYCQSQLYSGPTASSLDKDTIREEINPRTRHLFDVLEARIADSDMSKAERQRMRQLAFTAWLSALGLLTMLSVADATNDPLLHSDQDLLSTLSRVFDAAAKH
jgi:AcrR family transcriptional regulator